MASKNENRIFDILLDTANKFEIPCKPDVDGLGADVAIPNSNETIFIGYSIAPDEDGYEFGAAVNQLGPSELLEFSAGILQSNAIRGINERVDSQGKVIVQGNRDGLKDQTKKTIEIGFLDDWARVAEASDLVNDVLEKNRGRI